MHAIPTRHLTSCLLRPSRPFLSIPSIVSRFPVIRQFHSFKRPIESIPFRKSAVALAVHQRPIGSATHIRTMSSKQEPTEAELLERVTSSHFAKLRASDTETWAGSLHHDLTPISASLTPNPSITFSLTILPRHCNIANNLHGGAAATIFDIATTYVLTLINSETFWKTYGVSRTLNCAYLRGLPEGSKVTVKCEILSVGKRLTQMRGEMWDEEGRLCVTCEHGKVNVDSKL